MSVDAHSIQMSRSFNPDSSEAGDSVSVSRASFTSPPAESRAADGTLCLFTAASTWLCVTPPKMLSIAGAGSLFWSLAPAAQRPATNAAFPEPSGATLLR